MTKARSLSDFIESDGSVTLVDNRRLRLVQVMIFRSIMMVLAVTL